MGAPAEPAPQGVDADDADLAEFVRGQRARVHPVRVVLAVVALAASAWVLGPTLDELAYHVSSQRAPVDVTDVRGDDLAALKDGTWVRASVVLGNKGLDIPAWRPGSLRMGPITIREVVGAPLVVEFDAEREKRLTPFSDVDVDGRLVSFDPARGELAELAAWYERELGVALPRGTRAIVVGERPRALERYVVAWAGAASIVVLSWGSILRRVRPG
jgi:hypothetical protein